MTESDDDGKYKEGDFRIPPGFNSWVEQAFVRIKELWQYAMFRWCVYQAPLVVFGLLFEIGGLDFPGRIDKPGHLFGNDLSDYAILIWVLILAIPIVWVWRKPIWKLVKQALGFLNKKAEEV